MPRDDKNMSVFLYEDLSRAEAQRRGEGIGRKGWKRVKLGDLCEITTGHKDVNEGNAEGKYPFFTCSKSVFCSDSFSFDDEAILIAGNGDVGTLHYYCGKFEAYQRTYVLTKFSIDISYCKWYLEHKLMKELNEGKIGSSIPYIVRNQLASFNVHAPNNIQEQRKIANSIGAIDNLIKSLESLISKYEDIKKATVNLLLKPKAKWDKIRLGDFEPHRNNTCSRSLTSSSTGKIRNIHYGDILVKYGEIVSLELDQVDYLSEAGEAHSPNDYLQDGDIVIADTAEDETAGKVVEVQDVADQKAVAGLHTVFLRPPTDLFARGWLGYWMNSRFYHDQLLPYMTGIKVLSLSKSSLANTEISYPAREEQERLVRTLESIDTHIVALHAQVDKARQLKEGMMSYFFGRSTKEE